MIVNCPASYTNYMIEPNTVDKVSDFFEKTPAKNWYFSSYYYWHESRSNKTKKWFEAYCNDLERIMKSKKIINDIRSYCSALKKESVHTITEPKGSPKSNVTNIYNNGKESATFNQKFTINNGESSSVSLKRKIGSLFNEEDSTLESSLGDPFYITDNDDNDDNDSPSHLVFKLPELPKRFDNINVAMYPEPRSNSQWIVESDGNKKYNVSKLWYQYKLDSILKAKNDGLYLESDFQNILALSNILLISPNEHPGDIVDRFGEEALRVIEKQLNRKFNLKKEEFDWSTLTSINKILKDVEKEKITIIQAADQVHQLAYSCSCPNYQSIIIGIRNMLENLPSHPIKNNVGEMELFSSYLDPVLRPIFTNNIGNKKSSFRWFNEKLNNTSKRPDAVANLIDQSQWGPYNLFGEVKPVSSIDNTYNLVLDLIRLGHFAKNSIDHSSMKCIICFQAIVSLLGDGLYVMYKIGKIYVPKCINDIVRYVSSLDILLDVQSIYNDLCIPIKDVEELKLHKLNMKTSLSTPEFDRIVCKNKNRKRSCSHNFV